MTRIDVDVVGRYAEDVAARMGCHGDASMGEFAIKWDAEREAVLVDVPTDADPMAFCDILAQLLGRKGCYWNVWLEPGCSQIVVGDKEVEE